MTTAHISGTLFDPSLTPQNAGEKGYEYIDDIFYDLLNPDEVIKDIIAFLREFGGKFGVPTNTSIDTYFGLYLPSKNL